LRIFVILPCSKHIIFILEKQEEEAMGCWGRSRFALVVLSTQIIFLIFFALMATYDYEVSVEQRWFYPSKYKI